jgi:hypothetical protein
MRFARLILLIGAFLALASPLSPAFARRVEECKVERVDYLRGPSCAPEIFNVGTSMSCPGSIKADSYPRCVCDRYNGICSPGVGTCATAPACKAGYRQDAFNNGNGNPNGPFYVGCYRSEAPASCRLPAFGVELYSACIPQTVWNDCPILKTRAELDSFLEQMDRSLPSYGSLFLSNRALIAKLTSNAGALACLVKNWDGNPLHEDLVAEMKKNFKNLTGRKYRESACKNEVPERISCAASDTTEVCVAQRDVDVASEFLKSSLDEVTLLVGDVVPASDPAYRQRLEAIAEDLAGYLK